MGEHNVSQETPRHVIGYDVDRVRMSTYGNVSTNCLNMNLRKGKSGRALSLISPSRPPGTCSLEGLKGAPRLAIPSLPMVGSDTTASSSMNWWLTRNFLR